MPSLGETLRQERLKQNRTLAEVASETCICSRYLDAVERDDASELPGDFFYRAYAKQYAEALRLDVKRVEAALPRTEIDAPATLQVLDTAYRVASIEGRTAWWRRMRPTWSLLLLFLALAGCSGLYAWWQQRTGDEETGMFTRSVAADQLR